LRAGSTTAPAPQRDRGATIAQSIVEPVLAFLPLAGAASTTVTFSGADVAIDLTIGEGALPIADEGLELYGDVGHLGDRRALIAFDVIAEDRVPPGATITSATLSLRAWQFEGDVAHVGLWTLAEAFSEAADWDYRTPSDKWSGAGAEGDSRATGCGRVTHADGVLAFDVTACMAPWLAGEPNYGWVLGDQGLEGTERVYAWLGDAESDEPPELTVTFDVPDDTGDTAAAPSVDGDLDRFDAAEGDCDDADAEVHPGRDDVCNDVDDDCDGVVDEDCVEAIGETGCGCGEPSPGAALLLVPALISRRRASSGARRSRRAPS
jgi:hypothetical protein